MIKINKIIKKYDNFTLNVSDINIKEGDKIAIIGRNGSGKTTFVETLLKLIKSDTFDIKWNRKKYRINAVFQDANFYSNFKIIDIIKIYLRLLKVDKKIDVNQLLMDYELNHIKLNKYHQLSGGEKQKVKICVAFMNNPQILILDEVTVSLDLVWQKKIMQLIKKYYIENKKASLLFITHSMNDVREICNRALLFKNGKILEKYRITNLNKSKVLNNIEKEIYDKEY